jgi:hypothetical protein
MAALMLGGGDRTDSAASVATQITHAPRPRKKKRRPRS